MRTKILNENEIILLRFQNFLDESKKGFESSNYFKDYHLFNYFQISFALIEKYVKMYFNGNYDKFHIKTENNFIEIREISNALKHNPLTFNENYIIKEFENGDTQILFDSSNFNGFVIKSKKSKKKEIEKKVTMDKFNEYHNKLKELKIKFEEI